MGAKKRANKELVMVENEIAFWRSKLEEKETICNPPIEVTEEIIRIYGYINELLHTRELLWRVLGIL